MKLSHLYFTPVWLALIASLAVADSPLPKPVQPNIVIILADDK